ncbi:MAG: hypothetical protein JNK05_30990 [Myxococcales bacterium]|nr:hypothetical protein [Myxococcales bacterium]
MSERTVYDDPYATVTYFPDRKLVIYRRKATPYPDAKTVRASLEASRASMPGTRLAHHVFLMDVREGPMRSDPEFESATRDAGPELSKMFLRSAVLVKTAVGKLQMNRIRQERNTAFEVFDDEAKALDYLLPPPATRSA